MKTMFTLLVSAFAIATLANQPASAKSAGLWADAPGSTVIAERRKPRVKGGSGCDDPGDVIEHPECR